MCSCRHLILWVAWQTRVSTEDRLSGLHSGLISLDLQVNNWAHSFQQHVRFNPVVCLTDMEKKNHTHRDQRSGTNSQWRTHTYTDKATCSSIWICNSMKKKNQLKLRVYRCYDWAFSSKHQKVSLRLPCTTTHQINSESQPNFLNTDVRVCACSC